MRNTVLIVCESVQHLAMATVLSKTLVDSGVRTSLYWSHAITEDMRVASYDHVLNDMLAIPGYLQRVSVVVFFTHEASPACLNSIRIGFIAKRSGAAVVTIQHGWIQPGLNFETSLKRVGFAGHDVDNSLAVRHFSPVIKYFGEDGIGYPLMQGDPVVTPVVKSNTQKVLIATNFNWGVYSRENVVAFLRSIRELKSNFPSLQLFHRGHPAEHLGGLKSEVGFYLEEVGVEKEPWGTLAEAMVWSDFVLTTPSTVALDARVYSRPVFVFTPPVFESAVSDYGFPAFFSPSTLTAQVSALLSDRFYAPPEVPRYRPAEFLAKINALQMQSRDYELDEESFLQYIGFLKLSGLSI
jgi:hypothetical protein